MPIEYGNLPTQPLPRWTDPVTIPDLPTETLAANPAATLGRSGGRVAVAGLVGRVTGFARTLVLAGVLGTATVGDAYNGAGNLPNMVYELLLGSVFASTVVPVLTRRGRRSPEFTQRVLVAATIGLGVVTVAGVACAPMIVRLFVTESGQRQLTTTFAYLLLPEIFFYGVTVLLTAVLNVRDSFAAAAWAPVVNNVIVLVTAGMFVLLPGPVTLTPASMTTAQVLVLGLGTTTGIVGQAGWVAVMLRRDGFRWNWRVRPLPYTWRPIRAGIPLLGWIIGYAVISQIGVAVTMRVAFDHGGVSIYTYADLLFQVPYGILAASLLTVLMPRISRSAAAGDESAVLADLRRGARYLTVGLVPITMAMALLGPVLTTLVFTGRVAPDSAHLIGVAIAASAFGLGPFALVMLQMRVFYAHNDTRVPTLINVIMVTTKVTVIAVSAALLPDHAVVVMICVACSLSYLAGATAGHLLLRRRHGLLGFSTVADTFTRVVWATAFAGMSCLAVVVSTPLAVSDPGTAHLITLAAGTTVGAAVFLGTARLIGIPELRRAVR